MKTRDIGSIELALSTTGIPSRNASHEYAAWLNSIKMQPDLHEFFLNYTPHGIRDIGVIGLISSDSIMEIDSMYSTTTRGRVLVFGDCMDGSYVGVNVDSGVPVWIMKGHLEAEYLNEGLVSYPHSLAHMLSASSESEDFPNDPFEAQDRYDKEA